MAEMADGGEIDWGEDLGNGFHVGNDVYITDSKSMYKGKTGFVSGVVGKDLLVTISEDGNDRSVVVSKKGVEILDAPEMADGGETDYDTKFNDYSKRVRYQDANERLTNFDLSELDLYEEMQYNHLIAQLSKTEALQVIINSVEGDYSQLNPSLAEIAESQDYFPEMRHGGRVKNKNV